MSTRLSRVLAALAALLAGLAVVRRSAGTREVPIAPGSWEPAE